MSCTPDSRAFHLFLRQVEIVVYVALLRGINVGGKKRVDMKQLKAAFEEAGMTSVRTYINSGNVIFSSTIRSHTRLTELLEEAVAGCCGFKVRALPKSWVNDTTMKCDVMFLWDDVARPSVAKEIPVKPEIEELKYVAGALIWRVDRSSVTRSGQMKLAGTPLYKRMTIRNCTTARKLLELMEQAV